MLDPDDPKEAVVRADMTKMGSNVHWMITPHSFDDNNTGLRFEFMHVDGQPVLQVYSNLRDKVVRFLFDVGGKLINSDVRPFPDPAMHLEPASPPEKSTAENPRDFPPFGETNTEGKDYHE